MSVQGRIREQQVHSEPESPHYKKYGKNYGGKKSLFIGHPRASTFLVFFFVAMKRCPIAAKIAGMLFSHWGIWTFSRFMRLLFATILCVWEI